MARKILFLMLILFPFMASVGVGDDTCLIPSGGGAYHSFVAPVIPPSETKSGKFVYLAQFKPHHGPFWEGNVVKLGLDEQGTIVDRGGDPALDSDGSLKPNAKPYWATRDWADLYQSNYVHNSARNICTYLGVSPHLKDTSNEFDPANTMLTPAVLGNPSHTTSEIINYIRGADVFDEDGDGDTTENRGFITGDVLHSEPLVVEYNYPDGTSQTMVYFGANDGMLHAVLDTKVDTNGTTTNYGEEAWAFIPPDQLHRLRLIVEGTGHEYFVDSSPKAYIEDIDGDGVLDTSDGDRIILVCGERKGGRSYFALDITDPEDPLFLWRISASNDTAVLGLPSGAGPDVVIPELGQTWSEPEFGIVKTFDNDTQGTSVFFIGAGFSPNNSSGKAIIAIRVMDGTVLRIFKNGVAGATGMDFSIASPVAVVDEDANGFVDKVYVGDLGGQIWRLGRFTDSEGDPLPFPQTDENIMNWEAHLLFQANAPPAPAQPRKFFYPPSVALEKGYDLILTGTGDREDPCNPTSSDRIYAIKDTHEDVTLSELDLVDVTVPGITPDLENPTADVDANGRIDRGWYIRLAAGEKVLAKGLLFNKVYYVTSFLPNQDCGMARLYAVDYKSGGPSLFTEHGKNIWSRVIGIGIPSRPIMFIHKTILKLFASTSTSPLSHSGSSSVSGAAILEIEPLAPPSNLFYLWWVLR